MLTVYIGNSAVTESYLSPASEEEARAAGPLGRVEVDEVGVTTYGVLSQRPHPAISQSVTTFCDQGEVGNGYPLSDFLRDVRLAFSSVHSSAPPAWVVCSDPAVGRLIALELQGAGGAVPVLDEVPADAGPGLSGPTAPPEQPPADEPAAI